MSFYAGSINTTTLSTSVAKNVLHIKASATVRCGLSEVLISSDFAPNEYTGEWNVVRTTTAGTTPTSGNTTIVKLNTFSPSAGCTFDGSSGYTTEPTFTEVLMQFSVHQKATFRWVAYPGRELFSSPTAANGIGVVCLQQTTVFTTNASCVWME